MSGLAKILAYYSGWIVLVLIILVVALGIAVVALAASVRRADRRRREIFAGSRGLDLEALLVGHTRERVALRDDVNAIQERLASVEARLRRSKGRLGIVRFDAFEGVGGEQSFALALLDEGGDGVVVSSLLGREEARVFGKPISGGGADRPLSAEEERAIAAAREGS